MMNIIEDASELVKWRSVEKSITELRNNSPVYLNPGFSENNYEMKSKKFSSVTKQSPLELLFETCKNIGHSLGLDEPLQNRKRQQLETKDEEIGVSGRKKQNISPVSHRSKSPFRIAMEEERKHLKPTVNVSVRTTPDSSGSPRTSNESQHYVDRQSKLLLENPINLFQNILPQNVSFNKSPQIDPLTSYHGIFNTFSPTLPPIIDSHQRLSCDCFLCLLLSMKPLLADPMAFPIQSKLNNIASPNMDHNKNDVFLASSFLASSERQSPMSIEYCMYCGLHCPSIQILLYHIHNTHLL